MIQAGLMIQEHPPSYDWYVREGSQLLTYGGLAQGGRLRGTPDLEYSGDRTLRTGEFAPTFLNP